MAETLATEEAIAAHRNFLLSLSPQASQVYAHHVGGYDVPSTEIQETENMDVGSFYIQMAHSGGMAYIANTSWWMLHVMDPQRKLTRTQSNRRSDELASYAISTIKGLMDQGVLTWGKDVPAPDLSEFQTVNPKLDDVDKGIIDLMEKHFDVDGESEHE